MDIKQHHGIKIGDLVKFKRPRTLMGQPPPVHLVTELCEPYPGLDRSDDPVNIRLHGNSGITHRANNFVVVRRA